MKAFNQTKVTKLTKAEVNSNVVSRCRTNQILEQGETFEFNINDKEKSIKTTEKSENNMGSIYCKDPNIQDQVSPGLFQVLV